MQVYLVESTIGVFAIDESGKIVADALFGKDKTQIVSKMQRLRRGVALDELSKVLQELKKRYDSVVVGDEDLRRAVASVWRGDCSVDPSSEVIKDFRKQLPLVAVRLKVEKSEKDYESFVRDITVELAKAAVGVAATKRDMHAIQAIRGIDDLDKTLNLFATRIREWYGLHFPELDKMIDKHEAYVRIVAEVGPRSGLTEQALTQLGVPQGLTRSIASAAASSMGGDILEEDLQWLRKFCEYWLDCYQLREKAERYAEAVMGAVAPNVSSLVGPLLGARLLSYAGGLENLAKLPASTIQVLGAEKALFRSFKTGARPPKHGIIFQHQSIHLSPRSQRGKISRALSGKLAIAARLDQYGGRFMGDDLRLSFEKRVKSIGKK